MARPGGGRTSPVERYLPLGYFAGALLLAMALLPTVLRPPQQPPTQSAALSPDAPPDDEQQSIISTLQRASTGTAGGGEGQGEGDPTAGVTATTVPVKALPRSCPKGFGNPPRQIESPYAAPCAPAFTGDNGGSTYKGVSASEVRVGIATCSYNASKDGPIPTDPEEDGNGVDTTLRVYTEYFNRNFQFYGRKLRIYVALVSECTAELLRTAVTKLDEEYGIFMLSSEQDHAHIEGVRRKLLTNTGYQQSEQWYRDAYPYDTSWVMDGTKLVRFNTELMCKQLAGKPAQYTVPPLQQQTRTFGAIIVGNTELNATNHEAELRSQCGEQYARFIALDSHASNDQMANALIQLRSSGVTTVSCYCPWNYLTVLTRTATAQSYYPEWIVTGSREIDNNFLARTSDPAQWAHAFGVFTKEMPRPAAQSDWMKAYKEVDPAGSPDFTVGRYGFHHFLQSANAIQAAGPTLTPRSAMEGLLRIPRRVPDPPYEVAGGYGPGDYTYSDYVGLVWWDNDAQDPDVGAPGAYRFVQAGKRYGEGDIPTTPLPFFTEGITQPPPR